ncbi:hypothetical protein O9X99_02090 [Agrobacterium salinitolerans]|uniref:Uncharacterized protein n=1 Tax=Agrobacterium salinitolerans TaxID=1183413 RepID=A0ABY3BUT4_9HYPH|nr:MULTISPECIES: hypothetical protein [Agrobacterium]MCZ7890458.1 hypothetical protein [Agrobacterium salinitolerans]TRA96820.1 hypothetical protein EXN23_00865 [Agrobacterium salinitolerans]
MATTTVTDTSYSNTLLRIHTLEQVVKAVQAEIEALWDELEALEPGGGGSGDQDRIYNITVGGSQIDMIDDVPQAPSVYDDISMHKRIWGTSTVVHGHLVDGATGMHPLVEQICSPDAAYASDFWTSSESVIGLLIGSNAEVYDALANDKDLARLLFGNFPEFNISTMLSDNLSLYGMIKTCESRLGSVESRLSAGGL